MYNVHVHVHNMYILYIRVFTCTVVLMYVYVYLENHHLHNTVSCPGCDSNLVLCRLYACTVQRVVSGGGGGVVSTTGCHGNRGGGRGEDIEGAPWALFCSVTAVEVCRASRQS